MGKIQAVICPQCGSSNAENLQDDKFLCRNCQATYFIDTEKLEVHVKHSFEPQKKPDVQPIDKSSLIKIIGGIFIALALLTAVSLAISFLYPKTTPTKPDFGVFAGRNNERPQKALIALSGNEPKLFILAEISNVNGSNYESSENRVVLQMFEPETKGLLKELEIIPPTRRDEFQRGGYSNTDISILENMIWCVNGEARIYAIDPDSLEIKQTNESITAQFDELASGIGSIEPITYEKGFKIQNNNGASYFYFPLENKLYTEEDYKQAKNGIDGKQLVTRFTFLPIIRMGGGIEKMKKLFQIRRFESEGGPGLRCIECVSPTIEELHTNKLQETGRTFDPKSINQEIELFTPERNYFNGQYLYNDENEVLIAFKRVANEKDAPVIQCLDAASGDTKWTIEAKSLSNKGDVTYSQYNSRVFKFKDVYYLTEIDYASAIDKNGKVLWTYNILNRNDWK